MDERILNSVRTLLDLSKDLASNSNQRLNKQRMRAIADELFNTTDLPAPLVNVVLAYIAIAVMHNVTLDAQNQVEHDVKIFILGILAGYEVTRRG